MAEDSDAPDDKSDGLAAIFWQSKVRIRAGSSALHSSAKMSSAASSADRSVNRTTWRPSAGGCWHDKMSDNSHRMGSIRSKCCCAFFFRFVDLEDVDAIDNSVSSMSELLLLTPLLLPPEWWA